MPVYRVSAEKENSQNVEQLWNGLTDRFRGTRADHRVTFDRHSPNCDPDTANPRQNLARKMAEMAARIARISTKGRCVSPRDVRALRNKVDGISRGMSLLRS